MPEMRNKHVNFVPAEISRMEQIFSPKLVQGLPWTIFIRVMEKIKVKVFCLDCDQNLSDVVWIVEMRGVAGDCWRAFIK